MRYPKRIVSVVLIAMVLCSMLSVSVSATNHTIKIGVGRVDVATGSTLRLRSKASTSSTTLAFAPDGEVVIVEGKIGNWYKVIYNLQEGYMHSDYLDVSIVENVELGYGVVNDTSVNMRKGPGTNYASLGKFTSGEKAYIIGINHQWYKVIYQGNICYIRSDYLDVTEFPYENRDSMKNPIFFKNGKTTGIPVSADALNGSATAPGIPDNKDENIQIPVGSASDIIATAKKLIGCPYKWAGATPSGFDCSGFVLYVFGAHGITLPRVSRSQYGEGTYVAKKDLQPGDLVFFFSTNKNVISHVGIYIGNGQFIHSSSSYGVIITDLESTYYQTRYYGARRIL